MNTRDRAIKRIYRDLQEFQKNPIEGVAACIPDDSNPFFLIINIKILHGIYKDIIFHLYLTIPENYPVKPPKLNLFEGQPFSDGFHHHIYGTNFCIDILDEAIMDSTQLKTGWSSGYTLQTLFMQMQNFLGDPDMPEDHLLNKQQIDDIRKLSLKYQNKIKIAGGQTATHKGSQPYPPFTEMKKSEQQDEKEKLMQIEKQRKTDLIMERLTCFMTKNHFLSKQDKQDIVFGYPIHYQVDKFQRIQLKPIQEILSYEGYYSEISAKNSQRNSNQQQQFKTAYGEGYNYWLPIYINEHHYLRSKQILQQQLNDKLNTINFKQQIMIIFPNLINKMTVNLLNGTMHQSIAAIEAYCHFVRLFFRLIEEYPEIQQQIDQQVLSVLCSDKQRNKKVLGDIGEFLVIVAVSSYSLSDPKLLSMIYREYYARQILWVQKNPLSQQFKKFNKKQILNEQFKISQISNNLLIFNITVAKTFCNQKFLTQLDQQYGVIDQTMAEQFIKNLKLQISNINDHCQLFKFLGFDLISSNIEYIYEFYLQAVYVSNLQGYTKNLNEFMQQENFAQVPNLKYLQLDFESLNKKEILTKLQQQVKEENKMDIEIQQNSIQIQKQDQNEVKPQLNQSVNNQQIEEQNQQSIKNQEQVENIDVEKQEKQIITKFEKVPDIIKQDNEQPQQQQQQIIEKPQQNLDKKKQKPKEKINFSDGW